MEEDFGDEDTTGKIKYAFNSDRSKKLLSSIEVQFMSPPSVKKKQVQTSTKFSIHTAGTYDHQIAAFFNSQICCFLQSSL